MLRLRQVVIAARDLEAATAPLRAALGLGEPFHDPNVGVFGLRNTVMALGDTFIEVVSPVAEDTAAGRHIERLGGDGGYMLLFQVDDHAAARARVDELGVRVVFDITLDDISDFHLHPADVPGAIVGIDRAEPPGSWRWGGPDWEATGSGRFTGATLSAPDPERNADIWARVLGATRAGTTVALDDGELRFEPGDRDALLGFHVDGLDIDATIAGVHIARAD